MAALTSSDVYSPQVPGLATVLGSGLGALHEVQRAQAQRYREAAAAAKLKQQQEAADARDLVPLNANGWLPHAELLNQRTKDFYAEVLDKYKDPNLSRYEKRQFGLAKQSELKAAADLSNEQGKAYKEKLALAADPRYNKAGLERALMDTFYHVDGDGNRTVIDPEKYDINSLDEAVANPAYFNRDKVLQTFIKQQADSESVRLGKAAPPGGYGVTRQASSDIFDVNPDGTLAINADGSYKIRDVNALIQRAHADPFMAAILRDNAAKSQQEAGAGAMTSYGQLTPEQNAALNGLQRAPNAERADLATILAPYGKVKSSSVQTYRAAPRPAAGAKPRVLKANEATATPTSGFNLSVGDNGETVTQQSPNPNKGGLSNFLTPTVQTTSTNPKLFDNHYPGVGVTFGTGTKPHIPLSVNTSELSTLGADGVTTKYNNGKSNSQITVNATDRSLVLEVGGKRLGLPKSGTSADAFEEMKGMIQRMTPEQARKTVLKAVYHGGTTDKATTSGDGSGGAAKIIGYKNADGEQLSGDALDAARRSGEFLNPVYDKEERQIKVLVPATAQLDAQAARQTPGYDPQKRTPQEQELIRLLEAKGGHVTDPYHTTPTKGAVSPPGPGGSIYKRPGATTPTVAPSRGGGIYKVR